MDIVAFWEEDEFVTHPVIDLSKSPSEQEFCNAGSMVSRQRRSASSFWSPFAPARSRPALPSRLGGRKPLSRRQSTRALRALDAIRARSELAPMTVTSALFPMKTSFEASLVPFARGLTRRMACGGRDG